MKPEIILLPQGDNPPKASLYYGQDVRKTLQELPENSVHTVCTSPPYWGLRDYGLEPSTWNDGWEGCLGLEPTHLMFVAHIVEVMQEVRRVLRPDGTLWLNLGDSYKGSWGNYKSSNRGSGHQRDMKTGNASFMSGGYEGKEEWRPPISNVIKGLKDKDLVGIPWRVALALQDDGWYLRSDIIWCLSGGVWVYARTQKGEMPMMVRDAARLGPTTVQLWNGKKWTQVLGWSENNRTGNEIELVLRSGERLGCTPDHEWPTNKGLKKTKDLIIGDVLQSVILPEPETPHNPPVISEDVAWFIGMYLAEGSKLDRGKKLQISGHMKETARFERIKKIAEFFGGTAACQIYGNCQNIQVFGKIIIAMLNTYLGGTDAKTKYLKPICWSHSNKWLSSLLEGYLEGDGHWDEKNNRWRLGFTRNYSWEQNLRTLTARLGLHLTLKPSISKIGNIPYPSFRGEIRFKKSGHFNEKDPNEIVKIRKSRCRKTYDIGVADEPHTFALASGVLTHNSKPNPMPESVRDRCTKSHEYVFMLTQNPKYFCDMDAIRELPSQEFHGLGDPNKPRKADRYTSRNGHSGLRVGYPAGSSGKNRRSVWIITTKPYPGSHFATWPPELVELMIKAGTSERGCCAVCGASWKRVIETSGGRDWHQDKMIDKGIVGELSGDAGHKRGQSASPLNNVRQRETVGWEPSCSCGSDHPPDSWDIIETPTGVRVGPDPTLQTGRAGLNRPRGEDEGRRLITKYEQRAYAEQLKDSEYRQEMAKEAGQSFDHYIRTDSSGARPVPQELLELWVKKGWLSHVEVPEKPKPSIKRCVVLDPFSGSGTTGLVALRLGCDYIGIDLNVEYLKLAQRRVLDLKAPKTDSTDEDSVLDMF